MQLCFTLLPQPVVRISACFLCMADSRSRSPTIQRAVAMVPSRLLHNGLVFVPYFPQSTHKTCHDILSVMTKAAARWPNLLCHSPSAAASEQRTFVRYLFFVCISSPCSNLMTSFRPQPGGQTTFATSRARSCLSPRCLKDLACQSRI